MTQTALPSNETPSNDTMVSNLSQNNATFMVLGEEKGDKGGRELQYMQAQAQAHPHFRVFKAGSLQNHVLQMARWTSAHNGGQDG